MSADGRHAFGSVVLVPVAIDQRPNRAAAQLTEILAQPPLPLE
jgi:hypothetical protein